ncbi:MAG: PEP-CTERM sorting domain-containing protein [Phycisphaerae bacterium]|nr:PEP-CTERM sorting domain-containing protein [Phycisphaerae bacterium]
MVKLEKKMVLIVSVLVIALTAFASAGTVTVATFADPAIGSAEPLFEINYNSGTLQGGWSGTGLTLEVPVAGLIYADATFELDPMTLEFPSNSGSSLAYYTNSGPSAIRFYDGTTEVLTIEFDRLWIQDRNSGLNGQDVYGDNVVITGIGVPALSLESFGFSFTNVVNNQGAVSATAAFTSSATVPEPATMALLALGGFMIRRRK